VSNGKDVKAHFEAILGWEIADDLDATIAIRETLGAYARESGPRVARDIGTTGASTKGCTGEGGMLDISGIAVTKADGTATFRLSDYHCVDLIAVEQPLNLVATARTGAPVFVTAQHSVSSDRRDVEITLMAWNARGEPVPGVAVDWRCRLPFQPIIL
jgi:hypothetical protein